jgi:ribosomal protein L11 methyltransferase
MPAYIKVLKAGGVLVMSGFYTTDLPMITEKATELGLKLTGSYYRSDWCAARFTY